MLVRTAPIDPPAITVHRKTDDILYLKIGLVPESLIKCLAVLLRRL